jgi:membrane fusion protein, copper/silver efflux system
VVVEKSAFAGSYVSTGESLFRVADLSHLWVLLEAFESDLSWLHYGQPIEFEAEALPGESFEGKIAFIAPVIDPQRRTATVRVNVPNAQGRLKPEMFVRARVRALTTGDGRVFDDSLAGRWISPMHPEIVKDHPGACDVCGMPLVSAESLGYAAHEHAAQEVPLLIPASAPLITGRRAVVYVALPDQEGVFEGREIVLGPRAGNFYQVQEGLAEGELVVVRGNFKIDSEVQIQARPSMMNPHGGGAVPGHDHGAKGGGSTAEPPAPRPAAPPQQGGVHRHD